MKISNNSLNSLGFSLVQHLQWGAESHLRWEDDSYLDIYELKAWRGSCVIAGQQDESGIHLDLQRRDGFQSSVGLNVQRWDQYHRGSLSMKLEKFWSDSRYNMCLGLEVNSIPSLAHQRSIYVYSLDRQENRMIRMHMDLNENMVDSLWFYSSGKSLAVPIQIVGRYFDVGFEIDPREEFWQALAMGQDLSKVEALRIMVPEFVDEYEMLEFLQAFETAGQLRFEMQVDGEWVSVHKDFDLSDFENRVLNWD